jgi:hypothetical protein
VKELRMSESFRVDHALALDNLFVQLLAVLRMTGIDFSTPSIGLAGLPSPGGGRSYPQHFEGA